MAAISRSPKAPDGSTGAGSTITSAVGGRTGSSDRGLMARMSGACSTRRRSTGRCQIPCRPGRFSAASESSHTAPGTGHSSEAVIEQ